jgi:hypothetical protein
MKFTTQLELQSQTTRLVESASYVANSEPKTGFSPSMIPCSKGVIPRTHTDDTSLDYNSKSRRLPDFKFELFPLHSPLLGESMFVSFPPLSNMLKFSGYSCFIRDLIRGQKTPLLRNEQNHLRTAYWAFGTEERRIRTPQMRQTKGQKTKEKGKEKQTRKALRKRHFGTWHSLLTYAHLSTCAKGSLRNPLHLSLLFSFFVLVSQFTTKGMLVSLAPKQNVFRLSNAFLFFRRTTVFVF